METIMQSPSIESFSYSWLKNLEPSSSEVAADHDGEASFIEMDPRLPPSKRFVRVPSADFRFDFPVSESPLALVHADELISNGYLVPLCVNDIDKKINDFDTEHNYYVSTSSSRQKLDHAVSSNRNRIRCVFLRRFSKRFFQKYLVFLLKPFFCKRDFERSSSMMKRKEYGGFSDTTPSPRRRRSSVAYNNSGDYWLQRRSCESESSIHEAVLHCKRTHAA